MSPAPSLEPPLDHRSTVVGNGGQRWSTGDGPTRRPPPDHRRTTGQPPSDHRSMAVDRQLMVGLNGGHRCHHVQPSGTTVATHGMKWQLTWLLTWRGGDITLLLSFELTTKGFIYTSIKGSNRDEKGSK
ncbi:hypothetical protein Tco_0925079 [Tanacetum coccineum]|uniref:Uncharacterized protein n=1 Tax=Tanacetum coccineum TaxID=301880 RepID=A0ABQ5D732_9ASTR